MPNNALEEQLVCEEFKNRLYYLYSSQPAYEDIKGDIRDEAAVMLNRLIKIYKLSINFDVYLEAYRNNFEKLCFMVKFFYV